MIGPLWPPCELPCPEHMHEGLLDCPFTSCPMKKADGSSLMPAIFLPDKGKNFQ